MKLLIVDDHQMFCEGLKALLERKSQFQVMGLVNKASDVIAAVRSLSPDMVMMDYNLGEGNGLVETQKILKLFPHIKVIMVSLHAKPTLIKEAFGMGVSAYLSKDSEFQAMVKAIEYLQKHDKYVTAEQAIILGAPKVGSDSAEPLTGRERQVMLMLAQGWSSKMIALDLDISVKTVDFHRKNMMNKLNVSSLVELTHHAVKQGLLDV